MARQFRPLVIGPHHIWPPLILAPMSGVTNRTMRALYKPFGLGLTVTEFVSANALQYASSAKRTMEMIDQHGLEKPVSTQLWGDDPELMAKAAVVVRECGADIVDINFGCPAPKITKINGGSACLRDLDRAEAIMKAVVAAVDCPVTMKMRLGWTEDRLVYIDAAKRAQNAGVQGVTLHARTARQFYKGSADWEHIKRLKHAVDIPVIGNGDIDDPGVAIERFTASGVDAIMLGRATLGNPWLISQIRDRMEGRPARPLPPPAERLRYAIEVHYAAMVEELGESRAVPQMRKHLALYFKGIPNAAVLRDRIMHLDRAAEVVTVVEQTIEALQQQRAA
ncbi:MAG: tRNA dihydrouridine synthase DusB [Candidatus Eremiobacteraeota bacterium]|nr:tRNA dihydrouridine synthase DusB [Candidatus Eremiobacteraeota bacterium]